MQEVYLALHITSHAPKTPNTQPSCLPHLARNSLFRLIYLLRRNFGQLIQLLLSHLAHSSEKQDKEQLDALFGHHEDSLDEETFEQLGTDSFVEAEETIPFDDELHDFDEGFEGFAVALWWGFGLEADLCDDEGLGCEGC